MRVVIVANVNKPKVRPALDEVIPWVRQRADVAGIDTDEQHVELDQLDFDAALVLGGDGTLLATARRLKGKRVPVMGVNFGRLGFLASFTPAQFKEHFENFVAGKLPISSRMTIEASVVDAEHQIDLMDDNAVSAQRRFHSRALNDAVISAGAPFRMVELTLGSDRDPGVQVPGDGLIIATPSGSTAYNVAAGGPIISPNIDALCITPLSPQSLSFRPVVHDAKSRITVVAKRVNRGTTLSCDGQESTILKQGDRVVVRRSPHDVLLAENPDAHEWRTLAEKLNWAAAPRYNAGGK
jgi:NAD+ kinase